MKETIWGYLAGDLASVNGPDGSEIMRVTKTARNTTPGARMHYMVWADHNGEAWVGKGTPRMAIAMRPV